MCGGGSDSGGGGGGGDDKQTTPTFKNLTEAAEAGYHGEAVNIEGKGLQKVEFADKSYDDKMANVSAGATTTAAPKDTTTTTTAPKSHDSFGTSVSKFLGFEEKDDGFYLDQVITQFNTMGPEKALERANYLKQSGLMDDVSLVDQTLNSLNQGGTGVVDLTQSKPISAPVQPKKTVDPTVSGTVMPTTEADYLAASGAATATYPSAPLTPSTEADYLKASGAATATFPQTLPDLTTQTVDQGNIFKTDDPTNLVQTVSSPIPNYQPTYNMFGDVVDDYQGIPDAVLNVLAEKEQTKPDPFIPTGGPGTFGTVDDYGNVILPGQQQTLTIPPDIPTGGPGTFSVSTLPPKIDDPDSQLLQEVPPNLETGEAKSFLGDSLLGKGFLDAASMLTAGGASLSNLAQQVANQPYISSLGMPTVRFDPEPNRDPSIQGPGAQFLQNLSDNLAESAQEKFKSLSPETQEIARRPIFPVDYTVGYGEGDVDPRLAMAAGLDPEGPPGIKIPDFLPFGGRRFDPAALAYSTVEAAPATVVPIATTAINPVLGPALGFGVAGGDAARDVKNSLNEAFVAGDLQQTPKYKKTLDIINQLPDAADFSDEEKAAKALQAIKNDVDVTTTVPVGGLGAFSTYLPFMKIPKLDKIASLFPKSSKILSSLGSNAFLRNLGFGVRGGAGESLTELGELELKDKLGVEITGGLGDEYKTPTRQKEDEAATAFALGFPFGILGGGASSANVGAVGGTPPLTFQTGQAPNVQTTSREATLGDLRSEQLNVTTPIVDLGTAGTFAQKPPTLASPTGPDTVPTVDLGPASTQEVIIGTQLIENILDNVQTNADGAKSPSSKDIREIFSIAKQTNMPMSMVEQIIETRGAPELVDPSVSPADLLKAQKDIANIIDTSPVDPVSGFKSPMGPQLEGIASLASSVNMDSSTLNKIVEQNKGAPYIVPTLSSLEAPVQQDTPLNLEGIPAIETSTDQETVGVEGKPRVRVTKDGPRVDLGTTTDATTTTDTVVEVPTDQNVVGATPDTNVTTDTTATVTTDTTPTVSTTVTIPETELDDTEDDTDSADIEVTIDEETGEPEIEEVKSTPSGPIVLPETSTDPDTGETVYQCPDGYKLAKGKDGFQCFRTSSVTFMRAGIGTRAYTSVRPSRTRPGQKTVDVKKVETTEAVKA